MLMPWDKSREIGIITLDRQHRELYEMVNSLNDAMGEGKGKLVAQQIFVRLPSALSRHFHAEDELLKGAGSPAYEQRQKRHGRQIEEIESFLRERSAEDPSAMIDLLYLMHSLLDGHIEDDRFCLRQEEVVQ